MPSQIVVVFLSRDQPRNETWKTHARVNQAFCRREPQPPEFRVSFLKQIFRSKSSLPLFSGFARKSVTLPSAQASNAWNMSFKPRGWDASIPSQSCADLANFSSRVTRETWASMPVPCWSKRPLFCLDQWDAPHAAVMVMSNKRWCLWLRNFTLTYQSSKPTLRWVIQLSRKVDRVPNRG